MSPRKTKLGRDPFKKTPAASSKPKAKRKKAPRPPGKIDLVSLLKTLREKGVVAVVERVRKCALNRAAYVASRFA